MPISRKCNIPALLLAACFIQGLPVCLVVPTSSVNGVPRLPKGKTADLLIKCSGGANIRRYIYHHNPRLRGGGLGTAEVACELMMIGRMKLEQNNYNKGHPLLLFIRQFKATYACGTSMKAQFFYLH
jgi:hypothetical protein